MPEQEINGENSDARSEPRLKHRGKKIMLAFLALFALLVLILASKSFSWIEVKKDKEPEFNYAPAYNPAYSGTELEISALSYLGAYLGEDNDLMILVEKIRKICCRWYQHHQTYDRHHGLQKLRYGRHNHNGQKVNDWYGQLQKIHPGNDFQNKRIASSLADRIQ